MPRDTEIAIKAVQNGRCSRFSARFGAFGELVEPEASRRGGGVHLIYENINPSRKTSVRGAGGRVRAEERSGSNNNIIVRGPRTAGDSLLPIAV